MKRILIAVAILAVAVGGGLVYKFWSDGAFEAGGSASDLLFARAEPITVPAIGGYSLASVDLGEGPVPLLTIPLDTWGGYAALFEANGGATPSKDSLFYRKGRFAVELVHEESATAQLQGYAAGRYPLIWAPMDSLPLLYDALKTDKRVAPRVLGLFDWSTGGDGILVKQSIRRPADLKGQVVLTSSNTPYSFLLLWYLAQNGLSGNDVKVVWVDDGPEALQRFRADDRIAAWVTWTPYLNDVVNPSSQDHIPGTRLLISSKDANQLIADVFVVRADLFQDRPDIMEVFVESLAEASESVGPRGLAAMASFYQLTDSAEARAMLDEVHLANFPESQMFFDDTNPIGAFKIFLLAQEYYRQLGVLGPDTSYEAERVLPGKVLPALAARGVLAHQKNRIADSFNQKAAFDIGDLENQRLVLANTVQLYFEAQKLDFDLSGTSPELRQNLTLLGQVAEQAKFLSTTVVKLVGYLDTAKVAEFKAQGNQAFIEASAQAKLISKKRAEFVKSVLVSQWGVDPSRLVTEGRGWDNPVDEADPAKNRRVEVRFLSFE